MLLFSNDTHASIYDVLVRVIAGIKQKTATVFLQPKLLIGFYIRHLTVQQSSDGTFCA